jgi:ABC-type sugar transport system substrate-binding protein
MNTKSKLTFAAAVVAMMFSAPAFAQSTDHTGTLQPSYYDNTGKQHVGDWAPSGGAKSIAAKPIMQTRPLYNSAVIPSEVRGGTSGYDPSIASQR